ncbi:uncharacterized protein B0J16DRAFT_383249 [Fusarium flagelliforme]|uniref:Ring finger protein (Triad) n=1 Tax=Fusarium flagelliforme TaxID=2675880 RepID=A0A395N414_9HYPO|nr:uncharacterized protein B0J16DRAFT_383249 [Fusarium flagelliforme]KAH7189383.1 hypothetical protein B0J16DRAFT_383249 [Fusarium flagelliforme]RFN54868.1 ring finger protein (triad) [Fusarium flagelliforme]
METSDDSDIEEIHQSTQELCTQEVTALFPDICLQSLASIAEPLGFIPQAVINHIIDLLESGKTYPKREPASHVLGKRKRDISEQDDDLAEIVLQAKRLYVPENREQPRLGLKDPPLVKHMIAGDFPFVPMKVIQHVLSENNSLLFPTYLALDEIIKQAGERIPFNWAYKKRPSPMPPKYREANIDESIRSADRSSERERGEVGLMEELKAARIARRHARMEQQNFDEARSRGEIKECECCFGDFAENRLVHCNGDDIHFFCIQCALRNAEIQVGLSKYELECLSTEGCNAGFSRKEREKFLPPSLASALDRMEQNESLRLAGLPDLAQCPFCCYAEEYPPVSVDKEFRCRKPDCMVTSCRVCNLATHIPKTCEEAAGEAARDKGLVVRREVEEAMSQALIRNCNKCNTPFIKEDGCNKMRCTKAGCYNVQCYVCSKSCGYNHFDRPERGGKVGNCPLFDNVDERHVKEVEKAEAETKQKVLEENPGLEPEFLDLDFSSKVKEDEARRLERAAARRNPHERPPRRDNNQQPQVNDLMNDLIRDAEDPNLLNQNAVGIWYQQQRRHERRQQQLRQQFQQAQQAQQQLQQAQQQALQAHQQAQQEAQQAQQQAQQEAQQAQQQALQAHQQAQQIQMQELEAMKDQFRRPIINTWQKFTNRGHVPMPIQLAPGQQAQPVALQPGPHPASVEPHLQQGPLPPMPNPNFAWQRNLP